LVEKWHLQKRINTQRKRKTKKKKKRKQRKDKEKRKEKKRIFRACDTKATWIARERGTGAFGDPILVCSINATLKLRNKTIKRKWNKIK
jgi:hypothetical protein